MTVKTSTRPQAPENVNPKTSSKPIDGTVLEADYAEDRLITMLAECQREFQKSMQGHYVEMNMPAA